MTTPITNRPAPWWLRELAHGRAAYEELLGWPVSVQVGNRVLIVAIGSSVAAMTMPAALGAAVCGELRRAIQCGPVLTDPDGLKWTFLTRPPEDLRTGIAGALARAHVDLARRGGHVVVPPAPTTPLATTTPAGRPVPLDRSWRWIEPPTPCRPLPPAYPAIAVTRRLTEPERVAA
ncbi:MAG: hypothetical protein GEV28_02555 [Actinophytocola sp.]|uniref:hypothetical protein n=1 Tax=Actinophytocola sp. TaxID=1872138 RepID=UPI00132BEAA4|nr:hypothetical protein [Actinophytocola sp.]MPZ79317.1 hypothetical protein [Actinophytocola sp.]